MANIFISNIIKSLGPVRFISGFLLSALFLIEMFDGVMTLDDFGVVFIFALFYNDLATNKLIFFTRWGKKNFFLSNYNPDQLRKTNIEEISDAKYRGRIVYQSYLFMNKESLCFNHHYNKLERGLDYGNEVDPIFLNNKMIRDKSIKTMVTAFLAIMCLLSWVWEIAGVSLEFQHRALAIVMIFAGASILTTSFLGHNHMKMMPKIIYSQIAIFLVASGLILIV